MFSYTEYTGFWPVLLVGIAAFSTFFGAMFALTYGRQKQIFTLVFFIILTGLFRYGQLLLLDDTEGLLYPVIALVLSIFSVLLAWRLVRPSKTKEDPDEMDDFTQPTTRKHHHYPVDGDSQRNQPQ